jgi:hypothetical protein
MAQQMSYENNFEGNNFAHRGVPYLDFLAVINRQLLPKSYFEIGTNTGDSLRVFSCDAVCVDPEFKIQSDIYANRRRTFMFQSTSDDFFAHEDLRHYLPAGPDVVFLDGLHRAEFLLRDFMNTERTSHPRTLILLHDCLPTNTRMAERIPRSGGEEEGSLRDAWTGDVWRFLFALRLCRSDLQVIYLDCPPTGLVAISNVNPRSTKLFDCYGQLIKAMRSISLTEDTHRDLWSMHPFLDTSALERQPEDITAYLNCR